MNLARLMQVLSSFCSKINHIYTFFTFYIHLQSFLDSGRILLPDCPLAMGCIFVQARDAPPAYRTKKLLPCRQQLDSGHMHSPYPPIRRHFTAVRRYICRPGRP